jgi:hypothetical protein
MGNAIYYNVIPLLFYWVDVIISYHSLILFYFKTRINQKTNGYNHINPIEYGL